jgi:hypothetical protein
MKWYLKISLIIFAVCIILAVISTFAMGGNEDGMFFIVLGIVMLIVASISFIVGLIMLIAGSPEYGKAFLLSSAIIFVVGTGVCGITLSVMNM